MLGLIVILAPLHHIRSPGLSTDRGMRLEDIPNRLETWRIGCKRPNMRFGVDRKVRPCGVVLRWQHSSLPKCTQLDAGF